MKKLAISLGSAVAALSMSGVANAAVLAPSSFTGPGTGGSTTPGALSTGTLNSTGASNGFNNFFTSDFVSVGATGGQTISTSQDGGASLATSPITLSASDILGGSLSISFRYAFAGRGPTSGADSFTVALLNAAGNTNLGTFFTLSGGSAGNLFSLNGTQSGSVSISGFTPGSYNIGLINSELSFDAGNSAAGFNNIDVSTTAIPFEFSPLGLVALGGAYYFAKKNKKAKSEISA
jgi:hypothetical protein